MTTTQNFTDYHLLGSTGLRVSPLSLGTMTFGQPDWGTDEEASRQIFDRYLEVGGNVIDTADVYAQGRSEELVGRFIRDSGTRDQVVLATKYSQGSWSGSRNPNWVGNGRKNMLAALDSSLRRLQTDYVDLYWMHIWDTVTPVEEVMSTVDSLVRSGKIRAFGLSNVPAWCAAKAQGLARSRGWEPVAALQMEYSLVERETEREHIPAALDLGMGIVPWSPLAHGFLTGKYRPDGDDLAGPGRLEQPNQRQVRQLLGGIKERYWKTLECVEAVAAETERSMAQVALTWVARRKGVSTTIVGASNMTQLDANLAALDFDLSADQIARLDEASAAEQIRQYAMSSPEIIAMFLTPGYRVTREPSWQSG